MNAELDAVRITILVDNQVGPGLVSEHGFAAWIEVDGRHLLFDTGQGAALLPNAAKLGIDLGATDVLLLSHGHYDHCGGVPLVVRRSPSTDVYCHPALTTPRYSIHNGVARSIAVPEPANAAIERFPHGVHWTEQAREIQPGVGVTGFIPRTTQYENTGGPFFLDPHGHQPDLIPDDLGLWIRTNKGLVVVVGCGHSGLINTLNHALRVSGATRLHAVIGGFHLNQASEARLVHTVAALQAFEPDLVMPCHCTGEAAVTRLRGALGRRFSSGFAGAQFRLGGAEGSSPEGPA